MLPMQSRPLMLRVVQRSTLVLAAMACGNVLHAQQPAISSQAREQAEYAPRSGDARLDRQLADLNLYAERYPQSFADEMSRYYSVPRDYVEAMLQQPSWKPGDIFMACALAQALAQPCRAVVREWSRDHEGGWEGVGQRLQPKAGTAIQRRVRKDLEQSYARWARPLPK